MAKRIHRLTTGAVTTANSKEGSWTADADYTLERIMVTPRAGNPLTNVQFYGDKGGVPIFRPDVPAELLDPLNPHNPELDIDLPKGDKFNYKLTNNCGATETFDISLVLDKAVYK